MKNKLKLTELSKYELNEDEMEKLYGGEMGCSNPTCGCCCVADDDVNYDLVGDSDHRASMDNIGTWSAEIGLIILAGISF